MKRSDWSLALFLLISPLMLAQTATPPPPVPASAPTMHQVPLPPSPQDLADASGPRQPVYIYLYSRITDHVNVDISEARLRRILPMIEEFRKEHPEAHVNATIFFSGASSQALAKRNPDTGIKDFVVGYMKRGIIEAGYDGTDEPTYDHRPMVQGINTKSVQERWMERANQDEKFLTEGRDPLTGDPKPGSVGGLMAMQDVFGKAACITGVSVGEDQHVQEGALANAKVPGAVGYPDIRPDVGDWEVLPLLRRYNTNAIMFGLPASNPEHIPGFGGSIMGVGRILSPVPDSSPELFWADNVLRSSESAGLGSRVIHGYEGPAALKDFSGKLNRSKIRIIHMELGSEVDYLKPDFAKAPLSPSLTYAYAHPDNPKLPQEARAGAEDVEAAYAKEASSLNWLVSEYFPANAGSRFVSNKDLMQMTAPSTGYSVSMSVLRAALKNALDKWGNDTFPPSYFQIGNHYLSLADTFQVLTDSLAELSRTGRLPESVHVAGVYGPIAMLNGHGPNVGDVSVTSLAKVCAQIAPGLHDATGYPMPKNTVPPALDVDGIKMNAAQFLRLMAQSVVDPTPNATLRVRMTYMFPGTAAIFPKTRSMEDVGATWTFKPAPLQTSGSTQATHANLQPQPKLNPGT